MNRRLLASTAAVLALGGALAACGDDKMSREEVIDKLVDEAGFSQEVATCLADEIGDDAEGVFNKAADGDEDASQQVLDATGVCMGSGSITVPDISLPDLEGVTIPDFTVPELPGITIP